MAFRARALRVAFSGVVLARLVWACGGDEAPLGGDPGGADAASDGLVPDVAQSGVDGAPGRDAAVPADAGVGADATADGAVLLDGGVDGDAGDDAGAPDAAEDAGVDASDAAPDAGTSFKFYDVNHVLATGQSLALGDEGAPALTNAQPYTNLMFSSGVIAGGGPFGTLDPLTEGDLVPGRNLAVETMSSSFANLVTKLAVDEVFAGLPPPANGHKLLVSIHARSATAYVGLRKGTAPYAEGMAQLAEGKTLTEGAGRTYVVRAVTVVHGEADHLSGNASYAADLAQWQSDYETDVKAATGQAEPVPLFQTQISSWTRLQNNVTTSTIPSQQLAAHVASPGKVILVGPKYHLPYGNDGLHLTNAGYQHMGEDYAKAYRRVVLEGKVWEPVRPRAVAIAGTVITVDFHVPAPPLVLDTVAVSDPGSYGFEYTDSGPNTPAIQSVAVAGPETVTVTLSGPPGANPRLAYAFTGQRRANAGPTTGPRGNLRDSDATPSRGGYALHNWCVHFSLPVP